MPGLSLREAAQHTGTSKSTILRAIQSGRLSAPRTDIGGYDIDPAELFRVYPPSPTGTVPDHSGPRNEGHGAASKTQQDATEIRIRNAGLEAEVKALREMVEEQRRRADEMREDRDSWRGQAERLAIAAPIVTPPPPAQNTTPAGPSSHTTLTATPRRSWWPWGRAV